ncbi:MAG: hypothetical protein ACTSRP_01530 [Candidatus Helarchaeota archaeon]
MAYKDNNLTSNKVNVEISLFKIIYIVTGILSLLFPWLIFFNRSPDSDFYLIYYFNFLGMGEIPAIFGFQINLLLNFSAIFGCVYLYGFIIGLLNVRIDGASPYKKFGRISVLLMLIGILGYYLCGVLHICPKLDCKIYPFTGMIFAITTICIEIYEYLKFESILFIRLKTFRFYTFTCKKCGNIYYAINPDGLCPECEKEKEFEDEHLTSSQIIHITNPPTPDKKAVKKQPIKPKIKPKRISISETLKKQAVQSKKQQKSGSIIDKVDIILCIILVILIIILVYLMPKLSL